MNRRIGVLGGTFDPIHCGHLDLGEAAQRALQLTSVLVMPSRRPPHRTAPLASDSTASRWPRTIAGRAGWQVSDSELTTTSRRIRSHAPPPARRGYVERAFSSSAPTRFSDPQLEGLSQILDAAQFAVVAAGPASRAARPAWRPGVARGYLGRQRQRFRGHRSFDRGRDADVSSTAIRQRCGEADRCTDWCPHLSSNTLKQHGLYRLPTQDQPEHRAMTKAAAGRLHGR